MTGGVPGTPVHYDSGLQVSQEPAMGAGGDVPQIQLQGHEVSSGSSPGEMRWPEWSDYRNDSLFIE